MGPGGDNTQGRDTRGKREEKYIVAYLLDLGRYDKPAALER